MPGATERAINMALRVVGLGEVERDFKRAGDAGEKSFAQVRKAANGASQEVSEYTARLRRVTAAAKQAFASIPDLNKGSAEQVAANRRDFILTAIDTEKQNMLFGRGESTQNFLDLANGYDRLGESAGRAGMSIARAGALGAGAGALLYGAKRFVQESAAAYMEHEAALARFAAELSLVGNETDATARDIEAMAERVQQSTLQTQEAALQGAAALAKIPGLTREGFEEALQVSARLADALQTDVADVIETYVAPAFKALAEDDMQAFYDATEGKLRPSLQKLVIDLAEAGRTADAQRALLDGLNQSAGDGPDGLTRTTNRLGDAWENLKIGFAQAFGDAATSSLDWIADRVDNLAGSTERAKHSWQVWLATLQKDWGRVNELMRAGPSQEQSAGGSLDRAFGRLSASAEQAARRELNARFGEKPKSRRGGGGRRSTGKSEAEREAERLKREAETAREAADRIAESNDDVVASYARRASEAEEKIGLEGAALRAVERRHEIEATLRRLNREEIEKEVEARRAAAIAAGKEFDEAQAVREATAAVDEKSDALRRYATELADAEEEQARFIESVQESQRVLEAIKSPMERFADDLERLQQLRFDGFLDVDEFDRAMDRMAERLADLRYEIDENAQAWAGFGDDVGGFLVDTIMDGGKAIDILRELVRMPLERLLQQQVANPVADWIDGLTGNNRDKNVASARAALPGDPQGQGVLVLPAQGAAQGLTQVQTSAFAASQALGMIPTTLGNPVVDLANQSDEAASSLGSLVPVTGQLHGAFGQVLALLSSQGGGGAGGFLSAVIGIAGLAMGGKGPNAALVGDVTATMAANPGLFASGTDSLPIGVPFEVGENGRERMVYHGGGRLEVQSNQRLRREASGSGLTVINNNTITIPERADPRRTASGISRSQQAGIERAHRKGLAMTRSSTR